MKVSQYAKHHFSAHCPLFIKEMQAKISRMSWKPIGKLDNDATSCYNCIARCPRGLPITHIMHGLAVYSKRLGLTPKKQPTAEFSQIFWDNLMKKGRVNELKLGLSMYFKDGFGEGIKNAMANQKLGQQMMKAKRMNPMEALGGHGVKSPGDLQKIIKKAQEIEEAKIQPAK